MAGVAENNGGVAARSQANPGALYVSGGFAALGGAAVAVFTGLILVRVSRRVLGLADGLSPSLGLAAFAVLLLCALALGVVSGGVLTVLSANPRKGRRAPAFAAGRKNAAPTEPAARTARATAVLCAVPFAVGSLIASVVAVAMGAVLAAPATWMVVAVHTVISTTLCGLGAYLGVKRFFGEVGARPGRNKAEGKRPKGRL